ncbi:Acyl-coa dehydrogenase family member 10, partial [Globisporangium splendens]
MGEFFNVIGLIGSFVVASALVPQIHKVYATKSADDISRKFQVLFILGVAMILVYGVGEGLWPIYIPAIMELAGGVSLFIMKIYYERKSRNEAMKPETSIALSPSATKSYEVVVTPQ